MDLLILCGDSEPIEWQSLSGASDLLNQHRTMFRPLDQEFDEREKDCT
jgi:hypothetical protein